MSRHRHPRRRRATVFGQPVFWALLITGCLVVAVASMI